MRYAAVLTAVLIVYWFTLSGYFNKNVLLVTGGLSIVVTVYLAARMRILDSETVPYVHGKTLGYYVWLFGEIIKANMAVVKAVLSPNMEISPTLVEVPMRHNTDLGRTMFANSITLTPGTVSVAFSQDHVLVHALLEEMSHAEDFQEMEERSGWSVSDPMDGLIKGRA